jgi:hypothetical protein
MTNQQIAHVLAQQGSLIPLDIFAQLNDSGIMVDQFIDSIDGFIDVEALVDSLEDVYDLTEI